MAHTERPPSPVDVSLTDIAIVGLACRYPGARNADEFWRNLRDGVESIVDVSRADLERAGVDGSLLRNPHYVRRSAPLQDLEGFDAGFFGLSPKDAAIMDPQHRHFLEIAWEALESSGYTPDRFPGSIGVFAGCGMSAYLMYNLVPNRHLMETVGMFLVRHTGNDKDFLSTRVSYSLNLRGPSVSVQTACSTSLVAIHMASQSLIAHECDMALAGGVTIELPHGVGYVYEEGEILSRDGKCRAFDAHSTGTVFGSGAGAVVLRRLQDALESGDQILAVVKGSAVNNDGATKIGYLAPSVDGQAEVIAEAQAVAAVSPDTIDYVEAHGTGTAVGDPIEVTALTQAFRRGTTRTGFCGLGSVKTNIGHTDTAAGVASVIKVVEALRHRQLPPTINFTAPNPLIDFASTPFYVNSALHDWPNGDHPRRAGVTSLGVGGTNAHVILEEAPATPPLPASDEWQVIPLSARTPTALDRATELLACHLTKTADRLADIAHTLQEGRRAFPHRRVVVGRTADEVRESLLSRDPQRVFSRVASSQEPGVVFMFPGGGAQYPGMGRDLYREFPVYRDAMDECLTLLARHVPANLKSLLYPASPVGVEDVELERPSFALPALFATSYALARLWVSWGVNPGGMVGHSMGEYVAACLAGVMTLDEALMLVSTRGRLFEQVPRGGMLSVPMPAETLTAMLPSGLSIAAVNGPALSVVSGPVDALAELERTLAAREVESQPLKISVAAHSSMLDCVLDEFRRAVRTIRLREPALPFVSNVTGNWVGPGEVTDPEYWVSHLRSTVRFDENLQALLTTPNLVLIEVGPGTTLTSLAKVHPAKTSSHSTIASLRHPRETVSDSLRLLQTFGALWMAGASIDWARLHAGQPRRRVSLPTYPFEHQRYWIDAAKSSDHAAIAGTTAVTRLATVDQWFFRPTWKRADRRPTPPPDPAEAGTWLIFLDEQGLGERLEATLRSHNHSVVVVEAGRHYQQKNVDRYVVTPGRREDYDAMLQALAADNKRPRRIVHLWSLSPQRPRAVSLEAIDGMLERSFYSLLFLAQALASQDLPESLRLTAVSNGMQQVIDEPVWHPIQATLLGPTRVIARELPSIACQSIDIELPRKGLGFGRPGAVQKDEAFVVDALLDELSAATPDPVVAYRNRHRWTEFHERVRLPRATDAPPLRDRGVYLITGGLGSIGLAHAAYLARTVKARLVLLTRTGLPPSETWNTYLRTHDATDETCLRIRQLQQLEEVGGEVMVVEADVANVLQVQKAVASAKARFGAIHGVIHAAGTMADTVIPLKTKESAAAVLAPKVRGTLVLDDVLAGVPLDFFVVFSSTSAILGPAGQVDYVAANAFLNAFAFHRADRAAGTTLAIDWGMWKDVGMAVDAARLLGHAPSSETTRQVSHPLLQSRISTSAGDAIFPAVLSTSAQWILDEHRFTSGAALVPGTAYLEWFRAAAEDLYGQRAAIISDVSFIAPLALGEREQRHVRLSAVKRGDRYDVTIASFVAPPGRDTPVWHEHASATIAAGAGDWPEALDLSVVRGRCARLVVPPGGNEPQTGQERHLQFGPRWKNLKHMWFGDGEAVAELRLANEFSRDLGDYPLHPALLDIATGFPLPLVQDYESGGDLYIPLSYGTVRIFGPLPARIFSHARCANTAEREVAVFDYTITDEHGTVMATISDFVMRRIADKSVLALDVPSDIGHVPPETHARGASATVLPEIMEIGLEHGITADEGVGAFARALANAQAPQVIVTSVHLDALMTLVDRAAEAEPAPAPRLSRPAVASTYVAPRTDMERKIGRLWQEILGVDQVGIRDNFFDLGGHSLLAVRLFNSLRKISGQNLPLSTLFEAPTVEQLAALLEKDTPQKTWSCVVPIQPRGSKPPFFCIHGLGGNIVEFLHIARYLKPDQPFYGIQARGLDGREAYFTRVEDFAAHYIREIKAIQPTGPYCLGGSSFGGLVAYEMAQQLRLQGESVSLLALFDSYGKNYPRPLETLTLWHRKLNNLRVRVDLHLGNLRQMSARERWGYVSEKFGQLPGRYQRRFMKRIDRLQEELRRLFLPKMLREQLRLTGESAKGLGRIDIPRAIRDVQVGVNQAARSYRLQPYDGPVTLFRATSQPPAIYPDRTNGWGELVRGPLMIYDVPGYHGAIIREPRVKALTDTLNQCLDDAHHGRLPDLARTPPDAVRGTDTERLRTVKVGHAHASLP